MIIYVVKAGDSLYSIANEYGLTAEEVADFNQFSNPENLAIGQTVLLPVGETAIEQSIATNGYLYPHINRETLSKTLPYLTFGTVFTYGFDTSGNLVTISDQEVIDIMREGGVAPLMLLSTLTPEGFFSNTLAHSLLNNVETQEILMENIVATMREKNYYGLDIDFEYVLPEDKDAFVAFIERITARMNEEGYEVTVALAPKVAADQPGLLYESHDYKRIGAAANYVLLMTYEWGYTYGPPMAVAPINKVREVLDYAITEIPPEKIFMGIPNYGYDWTLPFIQGESKAKSIGNVAAVELAIEVGSAIEFDEVAMSPYFYYNDAMGTSGNGSGNAVNAGNGDNSSNTAGSSAEAGAEGSGAIMRRIEIGSPLEGKVLKLGSIRDEAFASGVLGKGAAILPDLGEVHAPAAGVVSALFPTLHAIGLTTDEGAEVLIHIGLDTVQLGGEGFEALVSQGDRVEKGQLLIRFDKAFIESKGYCLETPVLITNSDGYLDVVETSAERVAPGENLLSLLQ